MRETRLVFSKEGKGVYISHLDLMRTMQRSFLRAGLRIWHTEGFNPRPYMVFALPLPVGCASSCELVDFRLLDDISNNVLADCLRPYCPVGITPVHAYYPERKFKDIKWLEMSGILEYDRETNARTANILEALFQRDELIIKRKTKRGEGDFDLIPHVKRFQAVSQGQTLLVSLILSAQEPSINPVLITSAMNRYLGTAAPVFASFRRIRLYDADMREYR